MAYNSRMHSPSERRSIPHAGRGRLHRLILTKRTAQWALVGLLILLLLPLGALAIPCAIGVRQQMAVRKIERLGGHVVPTQGGPAWLRGLAGQRAMRIFDRATLVNLGGTQATDADLTLLSQLRKVERLNLSDTAVTDAGLAELEGLTELKALDLSGTRVRGPGLQHLCGLSSLEYLYLVDTEITDASLIALQPLENLRELSLVGTKISAGAVSRLIQDRPQLRLRR